MPEFRCHYGPWLASPPGGVDRGLLLWGSRCHHVKREASRAGFRSGLVRVFSALINQPNPRLQRARSIATRWVALPLALALALLWPLVLPGYQFGGGASYEMVMVNGLRSAFNEQLLRGHFPLWNEWVGNGKVFLFWGSSFINYLTPFELLFSPKVDVGIYKVELVVIYALAAALLLWAGRFIGVRPWVAALSFFPCFIVGSMPNLSNWVAWSQVYLWGSASIGAMLLYFATGRRRLLPLYLGFTFLMVIGVRPDAFPLYLIFVAALVGVMLTERLIENPRRLRSALHAFAINALTFVTLPVAFYAWQLPMLLGLMEAGKDRLTPSSATPLQALEHFITALQVSEGSYFVLTWMLGAAAIHTATWAARRVQARSTAVVLRSVIAAGGVASLMAAVYVSFARLNGPALMVGQSSGYGQMVLGMAIAVIALKAALVSSMTAGNAGEKRVRFLTLVHRHVSWRHTWQWPVLLSGVYSVLFEDMPQTGAYLPIALPLKLVFLLALFYGTARGIDDDNTLIRRLVRSIVLCLGIGWILRDFISLPLCDMFNIIWTTRAEFFWYLPCLSLLFMLGLDGLATDLIRGFASVKDRTPDMGRRVARFERFIVILAISAFAVPFVQSVLMAFYVPEGTYHSNAVWRHMPPEELQRSKERRAEVVRLYRSVVERLGPDAKILTQALDLSVPNPLEDIGYPGGSAGEGVHDAWSHDFVGEHYRRLAERAFVDPIDPNNYGLDYEPVPRLYLYNPAGRKVYQRFAHTYRGGAKKATQGVQANWVRTLLLESGKEPDPFFLQIMRVGGIMPAHGALHPIPGLERFEPRDEEIWGQPVAYTFTPARALRRIAFLPADGATPEALNKALLSENRAELVALYDRLRITDGEMAEAGVRIAMTTFGPDRIDLTLSAVRSGALVVFDAWDPGWQATRNGIPTEVARAFIAMRAIQIGPGTNVIALRFWPVGLSAGLAISFAAFAFALWWGRRSYRADR